MRKNMKKRAALLLAAMMTVSVTACGGGKTPDAPSDADLKKGCTGIYHRSSRRICQDFKFPCRRQWRR